MGVVILGTGILCIISFDTHGIPVRAIYYIRGSTLRQALPIHLFDSASYSCRFTGLRTAVPAFQPAETFMTCLTQSGPFCFFFERVDESQG